MQLSLSRAIVNPKVILAQSLAQPHRHVRVLLSDHPPLIIPPIRPQSTSTSITAQLFPLKRSFSSIPPSPPTPSLNQPAFIVNQTLNPAQQSFYRIYQQPNQGPNRTTTVLNQDLSPTTRTSTTRTPHRRQQLSHNHHHSHSHNQTASTPHITTRQNLSQSLPQLFSYLTVRRKPPHHHPSITQLPNMNSLSNTTVTTITTTTNSRLQTDRTYFTHKGDVDAVIAKLNYSVRLPPQFQANFLRLGADTATRDFVTECVRKFNRCFCLNWGLSVLRTTLAWCMNHTDIIGLLKVGLMHIISAKQLQLLLQHSYTVEKPLNSDDFKQFNFTEWLQAQKQQQQAQGLTDSIAKAVAQASTSDGQIRPNNRQHRPNDSPPSEPTLQRKNSSSSAHRSKTLLAGSLLGVSVDSDSDNDGDGHVRSDDNTYEQHKLNLDHIFGLYGTSADAIIKPSSGEVKFDRLNGNDVEDQFQARDGTYQTYQQIMFGQSGLANCPDYLQDEDLLPVKYGKMLDVGAGSGRMAELLSPVFDSIECTEVSEQMVKSIRSKGFVAHYVDNLDQMGQKDKYDVVCLFNLIDRCEEPISLLYQLHQRLKPQLQQHRDALISAAKSKSSSITPLDFNNPTHPNGASSASRDNIQTEPYNNLNGRVVIAVPLPLRPSVEMTLDNSSTSWRDPKENIAMSKCWCCTSFEESLQHLVMNIIEPCGYDVLTVSRLPYLSEGNMHHSHFVLEDVVLICAPKPEWSP